MAPKRAPAPTAVPPSTGSPSHGQTTGSSQPTRAAPNTPAKNPVTQKSSLSANAKANIKNASDAQEILTGIWNRYVDDTPQRTKLIDVFMAFLVVVGGLQFVYCVLAGNYPFNAFLSGFTATVGQFVLTASLRIQTNPENKVDFHGRSHERAFADFVLGSLILHFFCVNFIN